MIKNKRIHLIGIGGISMSALAKYLMNNNYAHFNMNKENIAKDYQLLLTKK